VPPRITPAQPAPPGAHGPARVSPAPLPCDRCGDAARPHRSARGRRAARPGPAPMPMKTTPIGARMAASYSTSSGPCRASRQLPPPAHQRAPAPGPAHSGSAAAPAPPAAVAARAGPAPSAARSHLSWLHSQPPCACAAAPGAPRSYPMACCLRAAWQPRRPAAGACLKPQTSTSTLPTCAQWRPRTLALARRPCHVSAVPAPSEERAPLCRTWRCARGGRGAPAAPAAAGAAAGAGAVAARRPMRPPGPGAASPGRGRACTAESRPRRLRAPGRARVRQAGRLARVAAERVPPVAACSGCALGDVWVSPAHHAAKREGDLQHSHKRKGDAPARLCAAKQRYRRRRAHGGPHVTSWCGERYAGCPGPPAQPRRAQECGACGGEGAKQRGRAPFSTRLCRKPSRLQSPMTPVCTNAQPPATAIESA